VRLKQAPRGLSLIEVIVALVVISGFGAALFVWAGQTLQVATRAAVVQRQAEVARNVTELAFALNPIERPTGEQITPTHRYQWTATATQGPADQRQLLFGLGPYQAALYRVRFTVTELGSAEPPGVSERLVAGYRQVRPIVASLPGLTLPGGSVAPGAAVPGGVPGGSTPPASNPPPTSVAPGVLAPPQPPR
jgi:prepilin-type N-terminal cleavage/methylation domain-containing protein